MIPELAGIPTGPLLGSCHAPLWKQILRAATILLHLSSAPAACAYSNGAPPFASVTIDSSPATCCQARFPEKSPQFWLPI